MAAKIRLADVIKGGGAEFIFLGSGAPLIISGGQRLSLEMRINGKEASIFLVLIDANGEVEICSGGVAEVSETYQGLIAELRAKSSPSFIKKHSKFLLGTVVGIAVASAIAFFSTSSVFGIGKKAGDELTNEELLQLMQLVQPNNGVRRDIPGIPLIGQIEPKPQPAMPPILDRPDFLKKPDVVAPVAIPAPADVPVEATAEAAEQELKSEPAFGLPAFDPDAFKAEAEKVKTDAAGTKNEASAEPQKEAEAGKDEAPANAEEPKPAAEAPKAPEPVPTPEKAPEAEKQTKAETGASPHSPTSDKSANAPTEGEFKPISQEEAQRQANAVVDRLMQSGMTTGQAGDVLKTLEALAATDYSEITPEMISKLPHEVALLLRESGIIGDVMEPAYTDGVPHRIIRLPDSVVEKYRGKDGIATIPEANSWAATGNVVRIPPPGGGDLKSPEDFARFGIQAP